VFLVNSRFPLVSATPSSSHRTGGHPTGALLLPKLRRYFAEFLNRSSPDRLGILYLPTCVGLGYGHRTNSLEAFLGSMGSMTSPERLGITSQRSQGPDLPGPPPTRLPRDDQRPGSPTLLRHPIACLPAAGRFAPLPKERSSPLATTARHGRAHGGTGISTGCASTTPSGLALAPDSPWADQPSPGTLGLPAEEILTPHSLLMPAFALDRAPPRLPSELHRPIDAPLPPHDKREVRGFGSGLEPRYIIRARPLDQ
jgi:hypothetical protein